MNIRRTAVAMAAVLLVAAPSSVAFAAGGGGGGSTTGGADIQVTGSASNGSVVATQTYIYTYQVKNSGPQVATSTVLTTALPPGVTLNWAQLQNYAFVINCTSAVDTSGTTQLTCPIFDMQPGTQQNILIDVNAPPVAGTVSDTATVSSTTPDPKPANNSFTVNVNVKSSTCPSMLGQTTLYGRVSGSGPGYLTMLINSVTYTVYTNFADPTSSQPLTSVVNLNCQLVPTTWIQIYNNVYVTGAVDNVNDTITATVIQTLFVKDPGA